MNKRILIVEDDFSLAEILAYNMRQEGFEVLLRAMVKMAFVRPSSSPRGSSFSI